MEIIALFQNLSDNYMRKCGEYEKNFYFLCLFLARFAAFCASISRFFSSRLRVLYESDCFGFPSPVSRFAIGTLYTIPSLKESRNY